jgi:hypothetical protein
VPADIVDNYTVERALGAGSWTIIDESVPGSLVSYTDVGLTPETLYSYRLTARNGGGPSGPSTEVSATTLVAPSVSLTAEHVATERGRKQIELVWHGLSGGNVEIWRNDSLVDTVPDSGLWIDYLKKGGTYTYEVCDAGGALCTPEAMVSF